MLMEVPLFVAELKKLAFSFGDDVAFKKEVTRLTKDTAFSNALTEWSAICQNGKFAQGEQLKQFNSLVDCYYQIYNENQFSERMSRAISAIDSVVSDHQSAISTSIQWSLVRFYRLMNAAVSDKRSHAAQNNGSFFGDSSAIMKRMDALEASVKTLTSQQEELKQELAQLKSAAAPEIETLEQPVRRSNRRR
jgi:hypothetical protein